MGVNAERSLDDLSEEVKERLRRKSTRLRVVVDADGVSAQINARGSQDLLLAHPSDMVIRKSSYIDGRTLAIGADKAARDLPRELVEKLQNPEQKVKITLTVYC